MCLFFPLVLGAWCGSDCISSWIHLFTLSITKCWRYLKYRCFSGIVLRLNLICIYVKQRWFITNLNSWRNKRFGKLTSFSFKRLEFSQMGRAMRRHGFGHIRTAKATTHRCPHEEALNTVDSFNWEQIPGLEFAHVQDIVNPQNLRMLEYIAMSG